MKIMKNLKINKKNIQNNNIRIQILIFINKEKILLKKQNKLIKQLNRLFYFIFQTK